MEIQYIQTAKDVLSIVIDAMAVLSFTIVLKVMQKVLQMKLLVLVYRVTIKQTQLLANMVNMTYK